MEDADRDELRLALVLNGGVSLAIWISGVVAEIDALRRCDDPAAVDHSEGDAASTLPVYSQILDALGVRVRVDVIAGTSAGGLNGGLLGTAIAAGKPYADVRELWLKLGDLDKLFNDGHGEKPPISLLQGEHVLYEQLKKRFTDALASADVAATDNPEETGRRVRMILTGTDVAGVSRDTRDSFDENLTITEHRLHARFAHGGDAGGMELPAGWAEVLPIDPAKRASMAEAVARAARTSASFPIAFEPSELTLSSAADTKATSALGDALVTRDGQNVADVMRVEGRHAPLRRWAIDGGVLDNSPIGVVLDTMAGLSTERAVQRAVVFVVPYTDDPLKPPEEMPDFSAVLGTALNMPRDVAYTDHLEEVEHDLARRAGDRTAFDTLLGLPTETLQRIAEDAYPTFWRLRAVTSVWTLVQRYRARLKDPPQAGVSFPGAKVATALADLAEEVGVRWLPAFAKDSDHLPTDLWAGITDEDSEWLWGGAPPERIALRIADWLMAARESTPLEAQGPRLRLTRCQRSVHAAVRAYRKVEGGRQLAEASAVDLAEAAAPTEVDATPDAPTLSRQQLVQTASDTWTSPVRDAARELLKLVASQLVEAHRTPGLTPDVQRILRVSNRAIKPPAQDVPEPSRPPITEEEARAGEVADVSRKLLMADIVWRALQGDLENEHQSSTRYEFLRLNAAAPLPFQRLKNVDHAKRVNGSPGQKLFGMQLGHFAGFVRSSWRANDFMWGRLDGAARLVDLLIAPRRLRLSPVTYENLLKIQGLREPVPAVPDGRTYLSPDDPAELERWRSCLQDTLAIKIIEAELGTIIKAMGTDTKNRGFAPEDPLLEALNPEHPAGPNSDLNPEDIQKRFLAYAKALEDRKHQPTAIKMLVKAEHDSPGGKHLMDHAGVVVGKVLEGQGGIEARAGKVVLIFGLRRLELDARIASRATRIWKKVTHPFGSQGK